MVGPAPHPLDFLTARPFAHRGLHDASIAENSLDAFDAAIFARMGIECDVRLSRDGVPFLFHDANLHRLTGVDGAFAERSAVELDRLPLRNGSPIPRLSALLIHTAGRVPLLLEVKATRWRVGAICAAIEKALTDYHGDVGVMSFNPLVARWFARRGKVARGLVVRDHRNQSSRARIQRTLALALARPDFLACDISDLPSSFCARIRQRGRPMLTWTVRNAAQRAIAATHADQIIFEADRP